MIVVMGLGDDESQKGTFHSSRRDQDRDQKDRNQKLKSYQAQFAAAPLFSALTPPPFSTPLPLAGPAPPPRGLPPSPFSTLPPTVAGPAPRRAASPKRKVAKAKVGTLGKKSQTIPNQTKPNQDKASPPFRPLGNPLQEDRLRVPPRRSDGCLLIGLSVGDDGFGDVEGVN